MRPHQLSTKGAALISPCCKPAARAMASAVTIRLSVAQPMSRLHHSNPTQRDVNFTRGLEQLTHLQADGLTHELRCSLQVVPRFQREVVGVGQ